MNRVCSVSVLMFLMVPGGAPALAQDAPAAPASPNTWQIDSNHTAAQFSARHMMVSTVRGKLGRVTGTVEYDGQNVASIQADVTIDAAGLNSGVEGRDRDLRSANFLDVEKFPTITFKSRRAEPAGAGRFRLIGDLTIKKVTKEVVIDVEGPSPILKQGNAARTGATATTKIDRRDFGVTFNRLMEGGGAVVGDEVTITIDIELIKRGPRAAGGSR